MKTRNYLFTLLITLCALSLSGCKEEEPEVLTPALQLLTDNIDAAAQGGQYSVRYQLDNPVEGAEITVENSAEWISGISTAEAGTITFTVAPNEALESRTATLKVTYPELKEAPQFTVKQAAADAPTLTLNKTDIQAEARGGDFTVGYTLTNPRPDGKVSAQTDVEWITGISTDTEGQIAFTVLANEAYEVRSAHVKVSYTGMEADADILVSQAAAEKIPDFTLTIQSTEYNSAVVSICPNDKEMTYFASAIPAAEYEALGSDDAVFQNDIDAFQAEADEWGESLSVIIGDYVLTGDQEQIEIQGLMPGIEYVFYAYGIEVEKAERLTDISREKFAAKENKVDFRFDIQVTGTHVDYKVDPQGYEGYYYADVFNSSNKEEMAMTEALHTNWENTRRMYVDIMGMSVEDFLNMKATKGIKETGLDIEANVERALIAYALDDQARIVSRLTYEFFETGDAVRSDLELTLNVTEINAHGGHLKITPSNDDPYTYMLCRAKDVEGLHTDADIINYLMKNYRLEEYTGVVEMDYTDLHPENEYKVFAFGYHGFAATTDVFTSSFTTPAAQIADIEIIINHDRFYDAMAVAQLDPGYAAYAQDGSAFMPIIPESKPAGAKIFWILLNSYTMDDPSVTDDTIVDAIINEGEPEPAIYIVNYGMTYQICAFAEDADGNRTELWKGERFTPQNAGVSDAAEFVAEYPSGSTTQAAARLSVVRR